jgi:hypothetical protein
MGTVVDLLALAVAAAILVALAVLAVRVVGPFVDGSALFRAGPGNGGPSGVQEEDPRRWDFTGARADAPPGSPESRDRAADPPDVAPR